MYDISKEALDIYHLVERHGWHVEAGCEQIKVYLERAIAEGKRIERGDSAPLSLDSP